MTTVAAAPRRSVSRWLPLGAALLLLASVVGAPTAAAATPFRFDLYHKGDFVSQSNVYQCVGASMQMMINLASPSEKDNRTAARQSELQELARSFRRTSFGASSNLNNSGPSGNPRGASSRGWAAGLTVAGMGTYKITTGESLSEAIHLGARLMRETGKPLGLLVWHGRHAWVVTGFEATADPLKDANFRVTHVWILDPFYPRTSSTWGKSAAPHTKLSLSQLGQDWVEWRRRSSPTGGPVWAMVAPYENWRSPERRPAARAVSSREVARLDRSGSHLARQ